MRIKCLITAYQGTPNWARTQTSRFGLPNMSPQHRPHSDLQTLFDLYKKAYLQQMLVHVIRKVAEQRKLGL